MHRSIIDKFPKTSAGRKYALALMIFFAATLLCSITPILSVFVFKTEPLFILTGSEWVTVVSMLGAFYFSANVVQKKFENSYESTVKSDKEEAKTEEK